MDKTTSDALHKSIIKWTKISKGTGVDKFWENCALCKEFALDRTLCYGCPVYARTGYKGCKGTPWYVWRDHHWGVHNNYSCKLKKVKGCTECDRLAQKELKFLVSLLPRIRKS